MSMEQFSLSQKVKELRIKKGYSQEILAEKTGLSLRTIQRIENDETEPRGDSLKRLAQAFNTSPDEMIDWIILEDNNYLVIMNLSALSFLLFPLLGVIIPLILWIYKKDKIQSVNELGKAILNFQITWTLLVFLSYVFLILGISLHLFGPVNTFLFLLPFLILYPYNIILIVWNAVRISQKKSYKYKPAIPILRL